jgi:glycine/D-amino acid oxidase-like deaminating enzyme
MLPLDVLIVGGGLQGLILLDEFAAQGRSCVLVTNSDLGQGQTLHSHGLLNTGFGFGGPELRERRDRLVLPFLRARGIQTYGEWFLLAPDEMTVGERVTAGSLPVGLDPGTAHIRRLAELNFPKRRLLESLARDHLGRVIRGQVKEMRATHGIDTVQVQLAATGEELVFAPAVVVAATGAGTKNFLSSLAAATLQLAKIRLRRVQMLCVKGPAGVLPATSLLSLVHGLNVVAHRDEGTVMWYSTPFQDDDPNFTEAPDDAEADVDADLVASGFRRLERLFPAIASSRQLRFAAYAGYRQDIGETAGTPVCELVEGTANLVIALPSLVVNAWSNAKIAVEIVDAVAPRALRQPDIPGGGVGVRVGRPREDRPGVSWKTWRQISMEPAARRKAGASAD